MTSVVTPPSGQADTCLAQVWELLQAGHSRSAMEQAEQLAAFTRFRPAALAYYAFAAAMENEREKALAALAAFSTPFDMEDGAALLAVGSAWFRLGDPESAIPYLYRARKDQDQHPLIAARLGACLLAAGRSSEALPVLEKAVQLLPASGGAWLNLARGYLAAGDAGKALGALDRAASCSDKDTSLYRTSRVEALSRLGRHGEAETVMRRAAENGEPGATASLVHMLGARGRHDEAWHLLKDALESYPEDTELMELAAEIARIGGRFGEAVHWLKRALEKRPEDAALWSALAMTGVRSAGRSIAREAADRALALTGEDTGIHRAQALTAHAHVLAEADESAAAEKAYRQALALAPGFAPALAGLGNLLMQRGRLEEAIGLFQVLKKVAPLHGWSQLIQAREVPDNSAVLEQMALAARRPTLEGPVQSHLLFTLAAAWEKKKEYDKAWHFAAEANSAAREHLRYRPEQHRARIDREIARFSRPFMESRAGYGLETMVPTFIIGMPRSGTTLVEQMLGSHSMAFGAGELSLVPELIQKLNAWEMKLGTRRSYPECIDELGREECRRLAEKHLAELQNHAPNAARVADKLPHNFEHVGLIKLLFPRARIVHLRREPRDVAVSNYFTDYACKFGGMGFAYDLAWLGEQLVDHQRIMDHWHRVFPGEILEVDYDALVEDVGGWARRIIGYLELPWEDGVLSFSRLERPVKTASAWQVRQPVYTTSKAKWKHYAAHLESLESTLADILPMPDPLPLPRVPAGLFLEGMAHLQAAKYVEAEAAFRALTVARPAHAAAHHFLGAALYQQQKLVQARKAMGRSLELLPIHPPWLENMLTVERALGNAAEVEKLEKLLAGSTNDRHFRPGNSFGLTDPDNGDA